jgi:hypothetical protein
MSETSESHLLDALRAELDHEYEAAERLAGRTQRAIAFTGAFFALVQAAAVSNLLKSLERHDQRVLLVIALSALAALAGAGVAALQQERLKTIRLVPLEQLENLIDVTYSSASAGGQEPRFNVSRELARLYATSIAERRKDNALRARSYVWTRWFCVASVVLTSGELGWALVSRLS